MPWPCRCVARRQLQLPVDEGIEPGRNKAFALGPEVSSFPLERNGVLFGFVKANYQWETYARAVTQGAEFNIVATFLVKPLKLGKP